MTRALTIRQPWASLIAVGRKTIETRSRSTKYRGPLLIHAGLHYPQAGDCLPGLIQHDALGTLMYWFGEAWTEEEQIAAGLPPDGDLHAFPLPLGAIVASCTLVDVVPICSWSPLNGPPAWAAHMIPLEGSDAPRLILVRDAALAAECLCDDGPLPVEIDATPQLPFGDFTPGRFAWILDDVQPTTDRCPRCWRTARAERPPVEWAECGDGVMLVHDGPYVFVDGECSCGTLDLGLPCPSCRSTGTCEPVRARGRQGLWTWTP